MIIYIIVSYSDQMEGFNQSQEHSKKKKSKPRGTEDECD